MLALESDMQGAAGVVVNSPTPVAVISRMDYRQLAGYTTLLLIVNVVLILSPHLPVIGVESHGARSWINLGMRLQPGEFAKITVILLDAGLIARYGAQLDDFREYLKVLGIMAVPFLCIMTQPDLGTGLVYLFIDAVALVMGGARLRHLLITLAGVRATQVNLYDIVLDYLDSQGMWDAQRIGEAQADA